MVLPSVQSLLWQTLDQRGVGHAAGLAHRLQPVSSARLFQSTQQVAGQPDAGRSDGLSERDSAAEHVHPFGIWPELLLPSQHHRRERFIDLEGVDVANADTGSAKQLLGCRNDTGQLQDRVVSRYGEMRDGGAWRQAEDTGSLLFGDQHGARAVADLT